MPSRKNISLLLIIVVLSQKTKQLEEFNYFFVRFLAAYMGVPELPDSAVLVHTKYH